jgi:hypothetical protein
MTDLTYQQRVLKEDFGMDPNSVMEWGGDLMWLVHEVSEVEDAWRWAEYCINVDHDDGEIDDLTHRRELNRVNKDLEESLEWLKECAWKVVRGEDY